MQPRRGRRRGGWRHHPREPREEYAYVLDFMPAGNPMDKHPYHRSRPVAQLIGESRFTLMDATVKDGVQLDVGERVYVGPARSLREKVDYVNADLTYDDLTGFAKEMLPQVVENIVRSREPVFVEFFNIAGPITLRFHSLELLPGIGKKSVMKLLEVREKQPFKSFEEIRKIIHVDPAKVIAERIVEELKGGQKYYLFVRPPPASGGEQPVFLDYLGKVYERLGIEQPGLGKRQGAGRRRGPGKA